MDKILRIDMGAKGGPKARVDTLGDYAGLGGRAMTSAIIAKEVPPTCHPLGPDNKIVFAPGLLGGTSASMSGRISVGYKSPLTGGIKEANAGGQAAQVIARLGYAAIVFEGQPGDGKLFQIFIDKDGFNIQPADELRMLGNYDLIEKLKGQYNKKATFISIGPAGEMKMHVSSVACTDREQRPTRHAARGGSGAVMGSKGVKVIILDDTGTKRIAPKDVEAFKAANRIFSDGMKKHPVTGEGLRAYGTNVLTNVLNEAGGYPTRNFQRGRFEGKDKISGETIAALEVERGGSDEHSCHTGCIIKCSGIYNDKDGNYLTKQPEYETVWAHGGHCEIDDPDAIAMMDRLDDDYGLDTIEMGAAIGVAMEAGIIEFGDAEGAINLLHEVGKGTPLGRILGGGAASVGKAYGVVRIPVVKGQSMPAYDPRAVQGNGVTYATSTMGADHTAGYAVTANILAVGGKVDPLGPAGQVELSRNLQIATAAIDSTGMCLFIAFPLLDQPETFQALIDIINSLHGLSLTADDVTALGKSVLTTERNFNIAAGFTSAHDRLPDYFKTEPLPPHNVVFGVTDKELDTVFNW
ncbi:MAG: aldehyde ferredoxin oxidoreductase [Gammaproteobacteria bacterium RBG_16_51_14]|nr:MAG: aldehyde ferredoxin oxidoreductase [Gammaproteobacteria bacterium RBG_16_51_14]